MGPGEREKEQETTELHSCREWGLAGLTPGWQDGHRWKHPALCGSASLLSDESFLLIMVAPSALEALLGVWITERFHEHLRMYENCGAGVWRGW